MVPGWSAVALPLVILLYQTQSEATVVLCLYELNAECECHLL